MLYSIDEKSFKKKFPINFFNKRFKFSTWTEYVEDEYNNFKSKNDEIYSRMIIQSFDNRDILTPEKVHQMGVEFAERYLKNES